MVWTSLNLLPTALATGYQAGARGPDLTSQPRPSPCSQQLAQQQACVLSLASEMPGLLLAQVGSSFSAEALELEDVLCHCLCCPRQKPAWRQAELKGGMRGNPIGNFDPDMSEVKLYPGSPVPGLKHSLFASFCFIWISVTYNQGVW